MPQDWECEYEQQYTEKTSTTQQRRLGATLEIPQLILPSRWQSVCVDLGNAHSSTHASDFSSAGSTMSGWSPWQNCEIVQVWLCHVQIFLIRVPPSLNPGTTLLPNPRDVTHSCSSRTTSKDSSYALKWLVVCGISCPRINTAHSERSSYRS